VCSREARVFEAPRHLAEGLVEPIRNVADRQPHDFTYLAEAEALNDSEQYDLPVLLGQRLQFGECAVAHFLSDERIERVRRLGAVGYVGGDLLAEFLIQFLLAERSDGEVVCDTKQPACKVLDARYAAPVYLPVKAEERFLDCLFGGVAVRPEKLPHIAQEGRFVTIDDRNEIERGILGVCRRRARSLCVPGAWVHEPFAPLSIMIDARAGNMFEKILLTFHNWLGPFLPVLF